MLKALETRLRERDAIWTEDRLWDAFAATAAPGTVHGRSRAGRFADLVALVRFALEQQPVLRPFAESVHERFNEWFVDKAAAGVGRPGHAHGVGQVASTEGDTPPEAAAIRLVGEHQPGLCAPAEGLVEHGQGQVGLTLVGDGRGDAGGGVAGRVFGPALGQVEPPRQGATLARTLTRPV